MLCGAENAIDYSETGGDAPCPNCGALLRRSDQLAERLRVTVFETLGLSPDTPLDSVRLDSLAVDSLDMVELIMKLEEEFDLNLLDDAAEQIETLGDLLRLIASGSNDR